MDDKYVRSPSDVREVIKHAKLKESDLTPITQVLRISDENSTSENLLFLQLDNALHDQIVNGGTLVIKGGRNENAVLCTPTQTYEIKEGETSNSLLLVPDLEWGKKTDDNSLNNSSITSLDSSGDSEILTPREIVNKDIVKILYTFLEPRVCKPKLRKLYGLLEYTTYTGPEREYAIDRNFLYTIDDLNDLVQASDAELLEGLADIHAIEIDGYYRILSFDYEFRIFSQMLDLIEENSWELKRIRKQETITSLNNLVTDAILEGLFKYYARETDLIDDEQYYEYDEVKVCRVFARYILKDTGKFNLDDFIKVWTESVPVGMTAEMDMLRGMVLCDLQSNPCLIWSFDESKLPENIDERFRILFQTKDKWTIDEIAPFIECYTTEKLNVNAILTKHTRGSTQNNTRYFSAKHSK